MTTRRSVLMLVACVLLLPGVAYAGKSARQVYYTDVKGNKQVAALEAEIDAKVDNLLSQVKRQLNNRTCEIPLVWPGESEWAKTDCARTRVRVNGSIRKAFGQSSQFTQNFPIHKKSARSPAWPQHFDRWLQAISRKVPHMKRMEFGIHDAYLPISYRHDHEVISLHNARQRGAEYLLNDGRTLLVFTFTDLPDFKNWTFSSLVRLSVIDVRSLPPEYWAMTFREVDIDDYTTPDRTLVGRIGNSQEWQELRQWATTMGWTRPLSAAPLEPGYPPIAGEAKERSLAYADLRFARMADHVRSASQLKYKKDHEQREIRAAERRAYREAVEALRSDSGRNTSGAYGFGAAANRILAMAEQENQMASVRNRVARQRVLASSGTGSVATNASSGTGSVATNASSGTGSVATSASSGTGNVAANAGSGQGETSSTAPRAPSSSSGSSGLVLSSTQLVPPSASPESCKATGRRWTRDTINPACYQRNQGFAPNQGSYCQGGYTLHYTDTDCDFDAAKSSLTQQAVARLDGRTFSANESLLSQGASQVFGRLCSADLRENGKFNVTTRVTGVSCEESLVRGPTREAPGVSCVAEVSYVCSLRNASEGPASSAGR